MNKDYFAKNLKFLRENKRISQTELANKLKINQASIAKRKKTKLVQAWTTSIAKFFNVKLPEFLGDDLSIEKNNFDEYNILFSKYKKFDPNDKELIKNIIETIKKQFDNQLNKG